MKFFSEKEHALYIRIDNINKMEKRLIDVEIPRLHMMQRLLHDGHPAIEAQHLIVNLLQDKISKSRAW